VTTLRFGVVGFGSMGQRHARVLREIDGIELVGAVDPHLGASMESCPMHESISALLRRGVDACVVAVPTPHHVATTIALVQAGVHVLVEKPLALELPGCAAVADAVERSGVVAGVAHVARFHEPVRALRSRICSGDLGDIVHIATLAEISPPRRTDGGGLALDVGCHDFDLVEWLSGRRIAADSIMVEPRESPIGTQDLVLTAALSGGGTVEIRLTTAARSRRRSVNVDGANGRHAEALLALRPDLPDPLTTQLEAFRDLILGRSGASGPWGVATLADATRAVRLGIVASSRLESAATPGS
jgi:UDP-N-acetylglucosamine 3-dehydrogenase